MHVNLHKTEMQPADVITSFISCCCV